MDASTCVHFFQQFFRQRIIAPQAKADHAEMSRRRDFKPGVAENESLELLSESDALRKKSFRHFFKQKLMDEKNGKNSVRFFEEFAVREKIAVPIWAGNEFFFSFISPKE